MQPANTPDPARDLGPPPARGASGTFASPSPPPSQPQAPPTGQGSASPLLTPPHPSRLLATLHSRDQTGSSRRVMPPPPSPGNSTEYTLTPFVPPAQSQLGTAAFRMCVQRGYVITGRERWSCIGHVTGSVGAAGQVIQRHLETSLQRERRGDVTTDQKRTMGCA
ncbi:hypothetical protein R6Z07F_011760 [Ovis aries]